MNTIINPFKHSARLTQKTLQAICNRMGGSYMPTKPTYIAQFLGGELAGRSQSMYGKATEPPWPFFDKAEHINIFGSDDFVRCSSYYVLTEPVKRVGTGCPTYLYQFAPGWKPPVKEEGKQLV